MLQFSPQEMAQIRTRVTDSIIQKLIKDNSEILNSETLVPEDARATWNLYYFCPKHGVRLSWDRNKPTEHACPVDGEIFSGEPYNGAWWRWLNTLNSKACYELGLLWQLTSEVQYFEKVKDILLQYSAYYPDYEVHGGIPYNGPGKANAQTLCEANCHLDFARGYDFIREQLSDSEKSIIEERLLREGAEFLIDHRTDQLHNHEMKINATIGVIGLLLNDSRYLDFALNTDYGLHYQLNRGCLGEGMWFEGSIHYHYYALQALLAYEKIAWRTEYTVSQNPNLIKMLKFPLNLMMISNGFPRLNDCIAGQELLTHVQIFEFANKAFPDEGFDKALNSIYHNVRCDNSVSRDNLEALLYGNDRLATKETLVCKSIHAPEAGYTLGYDSRYDNAFLLKHSPYGGEHDHYDRLGLIVVRKGKEILPDLGTTGYGAHLHKHYYKNSSTHNTLVVNQSNQPPINPIVHTYLETNEYRFVDTEVDWGGEPATVDSHTIVEWDQQVYADVKFRRCILWLGDAVIEFNKVLNPHSQRIDLTYHVRGQHQLGAGWNIAKNILTGPLSIMKNCHERKAIDECLLTYSIEEQNDFSQTIIVDRPCDFLVGTAPDNPATHELAYALVTSRSSVLNALVLHDLSCHSNYQISDVKWLDDSVSFLVSSHGKREKYHYDFNAYTLFSDILVS